jgi:hypothetical protein
MLPTGGLRTTAGPRHVTLSVTATGNNIILQLAAFSFSVSFKSPVSMTFHGYSVFIFIILL